MAEGIETGDGKTLNLEPAQGEPDQAFARIMAVPPDSDEKAPPKRGQRQPKTESDADKPRVARNVPRAPRTPVKDAQGGLTRDMRKQGMTGLAQLGAGLCAIIGNTKQDVAFKADAIVIASNAEEIGEACAATADQDARFAAVVDRLCAAGPYAALISVMVGVGTQCARNHGVDIPGTTAPEKILEMAEQQTEMAAA